VLGDRASIAARVSRSIGSAATGAGIVISGIRVSHQVSRAPLGSWLPSGYARTCIERQHFAPCVLARIGSDATGIRTDSCFSTEGRERLCP